MENQRSESKSRRKLKAVLQLAGLISMKPQFGLSRSCRKTLNKIQFNLNSTFVPKNSVLKENMYGQLLMQADTKHQLETL